MQAMFDHMTGTVSRQRKKSIKAAKGFRSLVEQAAAESSTDLIEVTPHRTFSWYVVMVSNGLEDIVRPHKPKLSGERAEVVRRNARQIIAAMRALFTDEQIAAKPELVADALREITPTRLAFERLIHYVITELQVNLQSKLRADGRPRWGSNAVLSRRPPRERAELPDPNQPAWASINRMKPKKVQIPCRIDPKLKPLIEEEAAEQDVSQSRWLEEAIIEKLQRQGHAVDLPKANQAPKKKPERARRVQRAQYPAPEKSPDAHDNRADYSTSTRMGPTLADEIDQARGKQDRSSWLNEAITAFLEQKAELPEPSDVREVQSEPFFVRFDRDFFPVVEASAKKTGLNRSEWYRRVARWYLEQ